LSAIASLALYLSLSGCSQLRANGIRLRPDNSWSGDGGFIEAVKPVAKTSDLVQVQSFISCNGLTSIISCASGADKSKRARAEFLANKFI